MAQRFSNPAPQFFYTGTPAAPLSGGLMYFYEPGTDTPKNTYSDNELSIPNANPIVLSSSGILPNTFLDGSYKVTLTDRNGVLQPGWPKDPVNSIVDIAFREWDPTTNYQMGGTNIVYASNGQYYVSIANDNLNHEPSASPAWWQPAIDYFLIGQTVVPVGEIAVGDAVTGLSGRPFSDFANLTKVNRTSNTQLVEADKSKWFNITSGSFTQTFEAAATLGNGWYVYYGNSGTGDVTIPSSDGVTNWIMYPGEMRLFQSDGAAITSFIIQPFRRVFTSSGTFTKPPGYQQFSGFIWGGGGGGNNAGVASGGGGGACIPFTLSSSALAATVTYTQGAGGAPLSVGGNSTFGSHVTAYGGGEAGNTASGGGGGALSAGNGSAPGLPARAGGTSDNSDGFGGAYGANSPSTSGGYSGYGGGAGSVTTAAGGGSVYGGGGGGSSPGLSVFGGNGGGAGQNGTQPGGGGGSGTTTGGAGQLTIFGVA